MTFVARSNEVDGTVQLSADERDAARRKVRDQLAEETLADHTTEAPTEAASSSDLRPGTKAGEYMIEGVLGRGGFGTVYCATHPLIGKRVAIKVLSRKYSADEEMVSRFVAEARAVNQIRHRHIIDIFSFGQLTDGRHYYVMEHLEGQPLDQYLAERGALTLDEALPILRAVARALDAAHAKGIAHRDLKPENIFLAREDEVLFPKLLDFGIAKLMSNDEQLAHKTGTGVPLGTPYYMSPEQCRGRDVDPQTDIYSFGVLAYRLLTGTYPFEGELIEILHKQMHEEPPPPSSRNAVLAPEVDRAITWMMRKEPAERPRTAIEAVVALQDDKTPTPKLAATTRAPVRPIGPAKRRWIVPVIAAGFVAVAAAVVAIVLAKQAPASQPVVGTEPAPAIIPGSAVVPDPVLPEAVRPPAHVIVTVEGVPEGTSVLIGKDVVGSAPGPMQLPRGTRDVVLSFRAPGHFQVARTVRPDRDQKLPVALRKRPQKVTRPGETEPDENDVSDPDSLFGKPKKTP
jgi:tRNA A-37 threonylcarbamoyl transferase component Bud32